MASAMPWTRKLNCDIKVAKLKAARACTKRHLTLQPAGHEEVAIYEVNQRIPNGRRIAGAALQRSNP